MIKTSLTVAVLTCGLALPAVADPSVGFGLSLSFNGGTVETGVGVRVFSDDERDSAALSVGLDYMIQSQRVRPTVGVAYLGDDSYVGIDLGFDLNGGGIDFGVGVGGVNTADPVMAAPAPVVVAAAPVAAPAPVTAVAAVAAPVLRTIGRPRGGNMIGPVPSGAVPLGRPGRPVRRP